MYEDYSDSVDFKFGVYADDFDFIGFKLGVISNF